MSRETPFLEHWIEDRNESHVTLNLELLLWLQFLI